MKIVVKSGDGQRYFKEAGGWSKEAGEAQIFKNTRTAVKYCKENKLSSAQVLMIFDDGTTCVRATINDAPETAPVGRRLRRPVADLYINYAG